MKSSVLKPVALVSMPTLSARFPSFQLGLLKPVLEAEGIPAQTFSLFMYFGTHVGWLKPSVLRGRRRILPNLRAEPGGHLPPRRLHDGRPAPRA